MGISNESTFLESIVVEPAQLLVVEPVKLPPFLTAVASAREPSGGLMNTDGLLGNQELLSKPNTVANTGTPVPEKTRKEYESCSNEDLELKLRNFHEFSVMDPSTWKPRIQVISEILERRKVRASRPCKGGRRSPLSLHSDSLFAAENAKSSSGGGGGARGRGYNSLAGHGAPQVRRPSALGSGPLTLTLAFLYYSARPLQRGVGKRNYEVEAPEAPNRTNTRAAGRGRGATVSARPGVAPRALSMPAAVAPADAAVAPADAAAAAVPVVLMLAGALLCLGEVMAIGSLSFARSTPGASPIPTHYALFSESPHCAGPSATPAAEAAGTNGARIGSNAS